jgi:endoglucanase
MRTRRTAARARVPAAIACAVLGLATGAAACGGTSGGTSQQRAADSFLSSYERPNGQIVRRDQGDDTVSEGQAYGMLLAEVAGNQTAFRQIWLWTRGHLQLRDGLFAYHASPAGKIISSQPAADADLLIAWALLRYRGPSQAAWHRDGLRVARAVLAHEVTVGPGKVPILAAGPWATGRPASLDPSYWALPAMQGLAQLTGQGQWRRLAAGTVTLVGTLTRDGRLLPPDWAELTSAGALNPEPAPDGSQPQTQYGPDAQRTVVWFAASCDPGARALAARWWALLRPGDRTQALSLQPDAAPLNPGPAVLPMVASAAAAQLSGDGGATRQLLQRAASQQRTHPTYYGGAWDALGQVLLTSTSLSGCD